MNLTLEERQRMQDEDLAAFQERATKWKLDNLPEPQLVSPERLEEVKEALSNPDNPVFARKSQHYDAEPDRFKDYLEAGTPLGVAVVEEDEPPVDLTDPLKHIRDTIIADVPEAATASDEELGVLYDQWEAKQGERDEEDLRPPQAE